MMHEDEKSPLIPQKEEGIEKVSWLNLDGDTFPLQNSYENIKLLFNDMDNW